MIVLRNGHKVYYPRLSIRCCLTLEKIYDDVLAPLMSYMSLETQVLIISLSVSHYNLTEDELYELIDTVDDVNSLILELYTSAGLISLGEQQSSSDSDSVGDSEQSSEVITFESQMNEMLVQCMSIGMREEDFYNSTLSQVTRYVEAHNKQKQQEMEEKAFFDWQLANLICMSVGRLMSKDAKYPKLHEAYGFLDTEENRQIREEQERKERLSHYKEYMKALAKNSKKKADEVE